MKISLKFYQKNKTFYLKNNFLWFIKTDSFGQKKNDFHSKFSEKRTGHSNYRRLRPFKLKLKLFTKKLTQICSIFHKF